MMLSEGLLNKQIAYELGVSEATIKAHVSAILQKLGGRLIFGITLLCAKMRRQRSHHGEDATNNADRYK